MHKVVVLALVAATLAGCADDEGPQTIEDDPVLVTDPRDLMAGNATGAHIHDYWGGLDMLTILDTVEGTGVTWSGPPIDIVDVYPPSETVVPQGTASVEVTMTWDEPGPAEGFSDPQLWVQTAADSELRYVADLESGTPVVIESTNQDNDLPHQLLSAWHFQLVVAQPDNVRPVYYGGDVTVHAVAHRGLDIPLYPGHPDQWDGATDFHLFDDSGVLQFYEGEAYTDRWGCYGGCPNVYSPAEGIIIPLDADHVAVTLTLEYDSPFVLGLAYHASDSRQWTFAEPVREEGTTRHYVLPVDGAMGDGPYALQSLWQFVPYVEAPQQDGWTLQEYDITAMVYRNP